ncbi:hypothetical protein KUL72_04375 [Bradyrhizobium arachidis]|uniref:hypothetical protein n=1 Tax=Bradyrhizobium arachidis TaxID=858423 RepID=UPI002162F1B4|nr:hypothetical protein [Bradyrhizobium arachidis]UVO37633.1 hypothetical protein KUL72_04375 [Bradyrhizobium arachidis]
MKMAKLVAAIATLSLLLLMFQSLHSYAAESFLERKGGDSPMAYTPIKRNSDGTFSVAQVTSCFLGRCPIAGDVCCHAYHQTVGNVYWCCRRGQQCVGYNGCQ